MDEQLIAAIEAKNFQRVEELLAAGANPNAKKGDRTAYQLVPHGADNIKCALIEAGAEDPELKHALVWVIFTGRVETVRVLIEKGADVNVSTYSGTPIQAAARQGYTEIVELLIAAGADVDAGSSISTPLQDAIEHGHTDIALKLIAAGANPNGASSFNPAKPIAMAAAQGSPEVIRALIAAGANVNINISHITLNRLKLQRETASNLQAAFGAMETVGRIMDSLEGLEDTDEVPAQIQSEMAQIESVSAQSRVRSTEPENAVDTTPIIIAARCGHAEALTILLEAGADPHCKDGEGLSAYDWAVRNEYPQILAVLRQFGIDGTRISLEERLLVAAENGNVALVRDCLGQGANPNTRDARRKTRDRTPLILASTAGHLTVVQALLATGADPNLTDRGADAQPVPKSLLEHSDPETILSMGFRFGRSALMYAAESGHPEIVRVLLLSGANPDRQDAVNYTALALAAENRHLNIVQALVAAGANVNQSVTYGKTPLMLACEKGTVEMVEFLLDRGAQVNAVSQDRNTALALAAGASHYVEVDRDVRSSGSGIREYRDDGSCWEWQALPEERVIEMVQLLLEAGADPNLPNCETTPLNEAARKGHLGLLQILLGAGASLEVRSRNGNTAVSEAKLYGQQHILAFLREYTGTDLSQFQQRQSQRPTDNDDFEDEEDFAENDERWGEELLPPDFSNAAQNPEYQQAVNDLAEICGSTPTLISEDRPGWFSIHVNSKRRKDIKTEELQRQFLQRGCFVYEFKYSRKEPEKLCILPTTDKYDAIALHQTNGCNYGIGPGYVVQWLKDLEQEQPFVLTCIAHDTLAGRFLTPIENPEELAARMYDFCSDIVEQGCGSVEFLAEELASSQKLFFWWD
ncbi:ankyrin repeat domain-containing protein [Floridanema evergladense]|uniref:Ankyrin repeat domain-containing protein n=1 Tax=Floridaenema evergladense BLCC-F167 TaxID=3153639 RepID=A0ABV4WJJ1_9CYAN